MIDTIIDDLLSQRGEYDRQLSPGQRQEKEQAELEGIVALGRSAIELEQSKAYVDIIEPHARKELEEGIRMLIVSGLSLTNDQKNGIISQMRAALSVPALIKDKKAEATVAGKVLSAQIKVEEKEKREIERETSRITSRKEAIKRVVRNEKAKERRLKNKTEVK